MSETKMSEKSLRSAWEGSWGAIEPAPHSVEAVTFYKMDKGIEVELISYPYRLLTRWSLKPGTPDRLTIDVSGESLIITGVGLKRLLQALVAGQLESVREQAEEEQSGRLQVYSIQFKCAK